MSITAQNIREQLEQAIANKQAEISEYQAALNILTDRNVESVEIKIPAGRPSTKGRTFIVKTRNKAKRGPGRPKGSTNRTPAIALAD